MHKATGYFNRLNIYSFTKNCYVFVFLALLSSAGDDAGNDKIAMWTKTLGKHGPKIASVLKEKDVTWEDLPQLTDTDLEKLLGVGGPLVTARTALAALKGHGIRFGHGDAARASRAALAQAVRAGDCPEVRAEAARLGVPFPA